jgi:hypothetical protein
MNLAIVSSFAESQYWIDGEGLTQSVVPHQPLLWFLFGPAFGRSDLRVIHFDVDVRLLGECGVERQAISHEDVLRPFLISGKTDRDQMQTGGDLGVTTGIPIEHSIDFYIGVIRFGQDLNGKQSSDERLVADEIQHCNRFVLRLL